MKEIVIKISEETYKEVCRVGLALCPRDKENLIKAIKKGTPLPKGHGDLKDANKLKRSFIIWCMATQGNFIDADIVSVIDNSPTIIFADKESE